MVSGGVLVDWSKRRERKNEVTRRAAQPSSMFSRCRVVGCTNAARAGTEEGLDTRFCRPHADRYARHGSPYRSSYRAAELAPYRRAARAWVGEHRADPWVANAIDRVTTIYRTSGPPVEAFRLRGLSPPERAKAAWARLRKAEIDPAAMVAAWLAVELIIAADPTADGKAEFKRVQAAKIVHRMASGTHKRWGEGHDAVELHVYPRSRGRVLRHIGEALEEAVELVVEHWTPPSVHAAQARLPAPVNDGVTV